MTYRVQDGVGATDTLIFTITVDEAGCTLPPTPPSNPSPANGATGVSLTPTLSWQDGDSRCGNDIVYQIHLREPSRRLGPFPLASTRTSQKSLQTPGPLTPNTTYGWTVYAMGPNGRISI